MIPRRVWFNLGVFALLFLLLTNWALRNILQLDVVEQPYRVSAVFESSPGLQPNTEVAYLGVRIGTIDSITLDNGQVTIEMDIDRNAQLPEGITAAVLRKSAVGEPYVSLEVPEGYDGGGPYVEPGDDYVIPIERTRVPIAFGDLFRTLDELVSQLPSDDLATVIHEVSVALQGNGPTLRLILESADELTSTLAARSDLFDALADDVIAITHTLAGHSDTITRTWDNLSLFAATLADARADIGALLEGAPRLGDRVAEITTLSSNDIVCTMEGVGSLMNSLAQRESLEGFEAVLDFADEAAAALAAVVHNVIEEDGVERPYLGISIPVDDVLQTLVEGGVDASLAPAPFYEPRPTLPDGPPLAGCGSVSAGPTAGEPDGTAAGPAPAPAVPPDPLEPSEPPEHAAEPEGASSDRDAGGELFPLAALTAALLLLATGAIALAMRPWRLVGAWRRRDDEPDVPDPLGYLVVDGRPVREDEADE